ncbi:MAG TPA: phosphatidylinositol mannoside acyltransferase [Acidimicrobiales bacterium]|nr:phosphatidylinositol mannoside acyltransferase [Acidimicrobiales bacterium]
MAGDRRQGSYLLYRGGAAALGILPRRAATALGAAGGYLVAACAPRRRAVVAANLRHVVGDALPAEALDRLVRRAFASYGRYWADAACLDASDAGRLPSLWSAEPESEERFVRAAKGGKGVILALPHIGSWEVGGIWATGLGHPLTTVAERSGGDDLFRWFVARREALGLHVLPLDNAAASELLSTLRRGGAIALLADRDIVGGGIETELFGERTRLPAGPALLALRSGAPLLPCAVFHDVDGMHHGVVLDALDTARRGHLREDVERVTADLARALEGLIRRAPEQWHVFQPNWPSDGAR